MRAWVVGAVVLLSAAAWLAGRRAEGPAPLRRAEPPAPPVAAPTSPPAEPSPLPPFEFRERLARGGRAELSELEQELEARLLEDRNFAAELFDAFRVESDPVRMSFLANLLAGDPPLRNSEAWQERFLAVAERDPSFERRAAALLFLQQAESIRAPRDRLLALAENDRELAPQTLAALRGLPERRRPDPRVPELAGRIADRETDPTLRGIALRIEDNPAHAVRFLSDPDRTVRMQASRVVTSVEAIGVALKAEQDPEVREMLQQRVEELK